VTALGRITAALALSLAACGGDGKREAPARHPVLPGWERIEERAAGFAVNLPHGAKRVDDVLQGGVKNHMIMSKSGSDRYVVGFIDGPDPTEGQGSRERLHESAQGFIDSCNGHLIGEGMLEGPDHPALKAWGVCNQNELVVGEIHAKNGRVIKLFAVATDSRTADSEEIKAFFKSFAFLDGHI